MELIEEILTTKGKKLQLLRGDLTQIPENHKIDVLVISAFPNDYVPTSSSLIGALHKTGLSIGHLAQEKEVDLRVQFHCWLSKEINILNVRRILCFEPTDRRNPFSLIAGIFQSIMPFTITHSIESVAMPLILTGDQGYSNEQVTKELISTSLFWLDNESSLKTIKIVERNYSKIELLKKSFQIQREVYDRRSGKTKYDFFISYSRLNDSIAKVIHEKLEKKFKLFFDTESINIGSNWLTKINLCLESSERFIVCISPEYIESKMCKYEYLFCNLKLINQGDDYVLPIYLYSSSLPFQMKILNYYDAREGERIKVENFCDRLIEKYTHQESTIRISEEETKAAEKMYKKSHYSGKRQNQTVHKDLINMEQILMKKLGEQDHIIKPICETIWEHSMGLAGKYPVTFLLIAPSEKEKIMLAKSLAELLFNDENAFIRFDMSLFKDEHEAMLLYGAPPGYPGYEKGGLLVSKISQQPYSVVLFDRIEKTHSSVFDLFLQISDEGNLCDRIGREGDFSNSIILFSSDEGKDLITEKFNKKNLPTSSDLSGIMSKYFRLEFLARVTEFVPFFNNSTEVS